MGTQTTLFCENCGAANEPRAICCSACNQPLQVEEAAKREDRSASLLADTILKGRYRIIEAVGQGGMGTVYRACDTDLNDRPVAIKEMLPGGLSTREAAAATEAFEREATLLAGLQHTNLPGVFEHFTENGRWYMVMTFIQGETLEEYLKRTKRDKLPLGEVLQISKQLCEVLYYLHSQYPPVIFRDVKPANIMRASDGQIYLIDFGVARRFKSGQKKDTTPFGSPGYAPPEQFGKAQTTPRSDIYSLGATMHQLLSGYEPDTTLFRFPPLQSLEPRVPHDLVRLIEQMLDMDEKQRPTNALVVKRKLQEISPPAPSLQLSSLVRPLAPATKKARRIHPWRLLAITLVVISSLALSSFVGDIFGTSSANLGYPSNVIATAQPRIDATATAQQFAALPDPYPPQGYLTLVDPLNQANTWQEDADTNWGGRCQFTNDAFQISQSVINRSYQCDESSSYTNFAIQVDMTIQKGDCGGLDVRENADDSQLYEFDVCSDGTYAFYNYYTSPAATTTLNVNSTNKAIKRGVKMNTLAIVANGSHFDLYVNDQKLESISDSSYTIGTIGLVAHAVNKATTVIYQNVVIWEIK